MAWLVSATSLKNRFLRAAAFSFPVVACLIITFHRNYRLFGDTFEFGYPTQSDLGTPINDFGMPWWKGFTGLVFSPGKSILLYAPVVILGGMGLAGLWKKNRALTIAAAGPMLTYILFYSKYGQWEGGYCYGPRYLLPTIPLLVIAAVPLLNEDHPKWKLIKWSLVAMCVLGFLTNLPAVMTSFLEAQRTMWTYYDQEANYQLSHQAALEQYTLTIRYLKEAFQEGPLATRVNSGLDFGVLHLLKVGAAPGVVVSFIVFSLACAVSGGCLIWKPAWMGLKQK